ncbi:mannitol dehydrogenase family protein [Marinovum sp. 2_MG-2023]|uniref:mannitol dehydrogenase family protein n=1 Tax=unclassified Marinovum TaxID=2647166 RepID=UPI0026E20C29|nr:MULTISPECIES: mannitol dehydrogenase family protein [unclassified Marinovum]MDO6731249.1 mannitol dehydrogenase family protein [Marinovum sp. 2_MG-2023]MDO6780599.1 mannitol dehydrogenase family protein [Marinovum sp. 1_MG-2023]
MEVGLPDRPRLTRTGATPKTGIVHLGPGAFFRAFNAVYTDEAMAAKGGDWGIVAVSLRSPTARDQMQPQGGAYTSVTLGADGNTAKVIHAITDVLVAPEDPDAVLAAMADPAVKIVSLTVTEKGYCHAPATGRLNADHPDITHDLAHPDQPKSAPGFLVSALAKRRAAGDTPFTVLSCDNLPSNGHLARGVVLDFARLVDGDLAEWIEANVPFPATMVDRITPATTDADVETLAADAGYYDPACVVHEAFRQWVIEDNFADGRPDWAVAGVQFVENVDAHETMKLRCLNGTHSTLAYLGYLGGYDTISDTVADPAYAALCDMLWRDEILPTVPQPEGEDLPAYAKALLARYRDTAIRHRTWQIAMDGSQKLPQRLLGTISDNLAAGRVPLGLCLAVAGWMRYIGGVDENGAKIDVRDPLADRLRAASDQGETPADKVAALLEIRDVFPAQLAENQAFNGAVTDAFVGLTNRGARSMVTGLVGSSQKV